MKYVYFLVILSLSLASCTDKSNEPGKTDVKESIKLEVDRKYRPLLHFFTSTNCGGCGRFGRPVFNEVAETMGDSIFALPTHFKYQDPFINTTSLAIEKAVVEHYTSPQIWVNMTEITYDIIPFSLTVAKEKTRVFLRNQMKDNAQAYLGMKAQLKSNGRYMVELAVERGAETTENLYYEIYGMEDGLIASQAGANPYVSTHNRVNRGGYFGSMGKKLEGAVSDVIREEVEYIPCQDCTSENIYFYAIVWKETSPGRYSYVNGIVYKP